MLSTWKRVLVLILWFFNSLINKFLTSIAPLISTCQKIAYLMSKWGKIASLMSTWANQSFWIKPSLRAFLSRFWIGWTVKEVLYNQQKFCLIYIEKMRHFNHPPGPTCWGTMRSGVWKKCESVTWNLYSLDQSNLFWMRSLSFWSCSISLGVARPLECKQSWFLNEMFNHFIIQ